MKFCFSGIILCYLVPLLIYAADWPVPKSIKCDSTGTFQCFHTGKFEDPFDPTCTKYFLCSEFDNERIKVTLTCPDNTFYDPVNERCSSNYKCICDSDNSSIIPVTTSATLTTTNLYPDECSICSQCITQTSTIAKSSEESIWTTHSLEKTTLFPKSSPSTSRNNVTNNTSIETSTSSATITDITESTPFSSRTNLPSFQTISTTQENIIKTTTLGLSTNITETSLVTEPITAVPHYCSIGGTFTCNKTGRFVSPNDSTCNSYYYCYVWSDGRVDQYLYSCSVGLFNPDKGACDRSYICPCSETSTSEMKTSSTTPKVSSSEPMSTSTETSPVTKTTIFETTKLSSESITATTPYCSVGGTFTCNKTGRFVSPNDTTCNSYYYCYVWSDGRVDQYLYTCSVGLFNPNKGACDRSYICPCSETNTSEMKTSSTTPKVSSSEPMTTSTETSPVTKTTSFETTKLSSESITATTAYCSVGGTFTCNKTGRFVSPNDSTCNSYYYCYVWSDGRVDQYLYTCSVGLFNPNKGACDRSYICPCSETNTSEMRTSSTSPLVTSSEPMPKSNETTTVSKIPITRKTESTTSTAFTCSYTGRFANQNDPTCKTYHYCLVYSNGRVRHSLNTCALGRFNPKRSRCEIFYQCSKEIV